MREYIKLLRCQHYIKNILIFLPFICGGQLFNGSLWINVILGFFSFSFLSSSVYIINDIKDKEKDKLHPTKCKRPIASGAVQVGTAVCLAVLLVIISAICNYFTYSGWLSWLVLILYFTLNIGYSFGLKNLPIIDIFILVSGFFLRVLYGSFITETEISNWMYLTVMMFSFYLGLGKRRNELIKNKEGTTRGVLKYYNQNFLDKFMYLCLAITIIFYSLWCVDATTVAKLGNRLIWTIPFVIAICMKYSLDIEGNNDGDPVNVVLKDKFLFFASILFVVAFTLLVYI